MGTHAYKNAAGKRVPSVTTIIGHRQVAGGLIHWAWDLGKQGLDYREVKGEAADTGTLTHSCVELQVRGEDWAHLLVGVEQERIDHVMRAMEAFTAWEAGTGITVLDTELAMVSERYQFGGCMDGVGRDEKDNLVILDWKTSKKSEHVRVDWVYQVAAYSWLYEETHGLEPKRAVIVRIDKETGEPEPHEVGEETLRMAWNGFLAMRDIYEMDARIRKAMKE